MSLNLDLGYLLILGAICLRFSILAALLPLMGDRGVPVLWRLTLALVVAIAVAPVVADTVNVDVLRLGWPAVLAEGGRSLLIGALLSFSIGLLFSAVRYAGKVMGMQIGFAIVNTVDPQSGAQVSIISQLYYLLAVMMFYAVDAHHIVLSALVHSCTALPPFSPVDGGAGAWLLVKEYGTIFKIGLQIAAPCVIVLLLVSATMGVVVKTVPQINILIVGFPIKIGVGLLTVGLSLAFFGEIFLSLLQGVEGQLVRLMTALT